MSSGYPDHEPKAKHIDMVALPNLQVKSKSLLLISILLIAIFCCGCGSYKPRTVYVFEFLSNRGDTLVVDISCTFKWGYWPWSSRTIHGIYWGTIPGDGLPGQFLRVPND